MQASEDFEHSSARGKSKGQATNLLIRWRTISVSFKKIMESINRNSDYIAYTRAVENLEVIVM